MQLQKQLSAGTFLAVLVLMIEPGCKSDANKANQIAKPDPSIAVLPFVNLNNEPGQEYFSNGLTEGIINSLSYLKGLKVSAPFSSFKFSGKNVDINEVEKDLGVHAVLEGSVEREGDKVSITAKLINTKEGSQYWSEKYDEKMDDIFSIQNKITSAIADKLEVTFMNTKLSNSKKPTTSIKAYELYLKGRASWNIGTPPELRKGIDFFQQAIAIDSSYAAPYSGIADCYTALGYGSFLSPKESFPKALEAATKALKLDSTLAEPHASLGYYKFYYEWDWAAAEQEFRMAIALNPNYALGYDWYGYYLTAMRRYDEAAVILNKAAELDPLSVRIATDVGFSTYYRGNYDLAIEKLQKVLKLNPHFALAMFWLGRAYQEKKMYPEAINAYESGIKIMSGWPVALGSMGNIYGVAGNKAEARKILDTLSAFSQKIYVSSYGVALVQIGLGEVDKTFYWLNNAYDERTHWLVWLKSDPRWRPIQSDKRFKELVNKVGLPN